MITGLAHLCFVVRDLDAAIAFYTDILGFTPAFDFINEQGERFGIYLHISGRNFVELFNGQPGSGTGSYQHLCLEVDDIDATVADLRAKGVEVTDAKLGSDQSWQAWLQDPDGNRIELHAYTPQSKQAPYLR
ncbi:MAG TPA: VOC family protein [Armatimonadota bacterium]|jgi:catechol 2,3-dioxygenase-like lactoylglutathione lyase family enzyme